MSQSLSQPEKRNIMLNGRRTTLQLERYIWENATLIAQRTNQPLSQILYDIWYNKGDMALAPAVRLVLMLYFTHYADSFTRPIESALWRDGNRISAAEAGPDPAQSSYHYALNRLQAMTS